MDHDRSGCLWFCGMDDYETLNDPRHADYLRHRQRAREFPDYARGVWYCTEACKRLQAPPRAPKPYGFSRNYESGPSSVAAAEERRPWAPSVDEHDLLADAREPKP